MAKFIPVKPYTGSLNDSKDAAVNIMGIPFDGTTSFRAGTRFGPQALRNVSDGLEFYCPKLDIDIEDFPYYDFGDLELAIGDTTSVMKTIGDAARELISTLPGKLLSLGGEHSVSKPLVFAHLEKYPDLVVVQFDAHCDLRQAYLGVDNSHASIMKAVGDKIGFDRIAQIGIRSGTQEEFTLARQHKTILQNPFTELPALLKRWSNRPVYLTIDLDVLDPSIFPGTGTPEPGGLMYREFEQLLHEFTNCNLVGADVVELSPDYDSSHVSSVTAAKVVREILGIWAKNR